MEPDVLAEAKDIVQAWIDKAGADGAVNMEVSLNNETLFRWLVKVLKMLWIDSSVLTGTVSWVKVSHLMLQDKTNQHCICTTLEKLQFCSLNAEQPTSIIINLKKVVC